MATVSNTPLRQIPAADYHAASGLSHSGMKDLAISPLRYWYLHINPDRPAPEETPEMRFGTALHCAVLEPKEFPNRYAREVSADDIEGCLRTADDLREWLRCKSLPVSGRTKQELVDRVLGNDPNAPIFDVIKAGHAAQNAGRIILTRDEWDRVRGATYALVNDEPRVAELLQRGTAEVSVFTQDPETGITLKARMDWVSDDYTLDLKTFTQKRGRSIDKSVADAIYYEGYYRQSYFYTHLRTLSESRRKPPKFIFPFVESEPPFEVRIRELKPTAHGNPNLYWERARIEIQGFIYTYADCVAKFGDKPWREARSIDALADEEIPAIAY